MIIGPFNQNLFNIVCHCCLNIKFLSYLWTLFYINITYYILSQHFHDFSLIFVILHFYEAFGKLLFMKYKHRKIGCMYRECSCAGWINGTGLSSDKYTRGVCSCFILQHACTYAFFFRCGSLTKSLMKISQYIIFSHMVDLK